MAIAITAIAICVPPVIEAIKNGQTIGKCLTQKGVKMYGSDTCEHCQAQKEYFGSDFSNIDYTNCDFHQQICQQNNIKKYPTWYLPSGQTVTGVQDPRQLAYLAGCL